MLLLLFGEERKSVKEKEDSGRTRGGDKGLRRGKVDLRVQRSRSFWRKCVVGKSLLLLLLLLLLLRSRWACVCACARVRVHVRV